MQKILKSFLKKLTNLTGTNRSLLLLRLSEEQDLDFHELDFLNGKSSFQLIEDLIAEKREIKICPLVDSRNENNNRVSTKLKKVDRREQFIFEERGSKDLYVGWPFIKGKFANGNAVRCPLMFFPVELNLKDSQWVINLREGIPVSFNKSFFLAYAHYSNSSISDDFLDTSLTELDDDSKSFRTQLYNLLKESPVELNFNQDLFIDKLQFFEQYKKADYEEKFGDGELKLFPEAVLGIFPQADSYLVPDYEVMIQNNKSEDIESFFLERSTSSGELKVIKEENTITPLPIDASQELAIQSIKKGKSMVVQGPPGTGKSQLISNLIADYISRGKNVLLVCQKRAALDVVNERLNKLGLENFISLVHDYKNDRKKIFRQLNHQIEHLEDYKAINNSLDSIYLERNFVQVCRRIEQLSTTLDEFRKALFNEEECGISPKELYLTSNPNTVFVDLKSVYKNFNREQIALFSRKLESVIPYARMIESVEFPWKERVSFAGFSLADNKNISELLNRLPDIIKNYNQRFLPFLGKKYTDEFDFYCHNQKKLGACLGFINSENEFDILKKILSEKKSFKKWLDEHQSKIKKCFTENRIELSLDNSQLATTYNKLGNAIKSGKNIFKWYSWFLFSKDKRVLQDLFRKNSIELKPANLNEMKLRLEKRMELESILETMSKSSWISKLPDERSEKVLLEWIGMHYAALNVAELLEEFKTFKNNVVKPSNSLEELKNQFNNFLTVLNEYDRDKRDWYHYLSQKQLDSIYKEPAFAKKLSETLSSHFEYLVAYDKIIEGLSSFEKETLQLLLDSSIDISTIVSLFDNSIRLSWLDSLEMKYPILRSVSSFEMEQMEKELQENCKLKEQISGQILLMNLREKTYKDIEYNRLDNRVTYRELQHQITKKKKVWPLRKVLSEFAEEVFHLTPCWLASPESVSSIFSMDVKFDLVIFDEASQCFSENGIPSIYRAKQMLITGDSKQLPPSDLYSVRFEEEEELPDMEIDSLLDLGKKYLSETTLTGHYRSKSLELIEFSNSNFYNHKLKILPHFDDANKKEPAIRFVKVDGIWKDNTNIEEAEEVISIVKELTTNESFKSIAVVTFNYKQQILIQDMLEETLGTTISQNVLVKNIENIQGDERDIVIFSLGYAPTASGKLSMNFGSLNSALGENRLNVAITRARERIYLVASILPHQLSVDELKNEGPRYLKSYLQYALDVSQGNFISKKLDSKKEKDWYLKAKLAKDVSNKISDELPFADLTIESNGNYKGLILTDDEIYYQSLSSKEAHAYLPFALKEKSWPYRRVYSRNYWMNSIALLNSITSTH